MAAHRLPDVTVVAEVIIHRALQGALEDRLRQPWPEPPALTV